MHLIINKENKIASHATITDMQQTMVSIPTQVHHQIRQLNIKTYMKQVTTVTTSYNVNKHHDQLQLNRTCTATSKFIKFKMVMIMSIHSIVSNTVRQLQLQAHQHYCSSGYVLYVLYVYALMINPHPHFPQDCLHHSHLQYYTSRVS